MLAPSDSKTQAEKSQLLCSREQSLILREDEESSRIISTLAQSSAGINLDHFLHEHTS